MNQFICFLLTIRPYLLKNNPFLIDNNILINKLTLESVCAYKVAINSDTGFEKVSKIRENQKEIYGVYGKIKEVWLRYTKHGDVIDIHYENGSISPAQSLYLKLYIKKTIY